MLSLKKALFVFCFLMLVIPKLVGATDFIAGSYNGRPWNIPTKYDQGSVFMPQLDPPMETIEIGVLYPEFSASKVKRKELFDKNKTHNYVHIMVTPLKGKGVPVSEIARKQAKFPEKNSLGEVKHGLTRLTEPYKDFQQESDIYFEQTDGEVASYVFCQKNIFDHKWNTFELLVGPEDYRCSHKFIDDDGFYIVTFHHDLLPKWKDIKTRSISLIQSFKQ